VFALFLVFRFGPVVAAFLLSFTKYEIGGHVTWLGGDNYRQLVNDDVFWNAMKVTAIYTAIVLPLITLTSLGLALLVYRAIRGVGLFRAIFFLPYVTSTVMTAVIWLWILRPTKTGFLNSILDYFGYDPVGWLQQKNTVLPALAVMSTWKGFGYSMLILVAGLQAIPAMYQEAARVDGAGSWQVFRQITLPLLKPVLFFVIVIESISAFQVFDSVYVMTSGGPARASYSLVYMVYNQGFVFFNFGYASAIGVALFLIIFVLTMIERRLLDRSEQ
jgi:multiple sugar transport system permease protein